MIRIRLIGLSACAIFFLLNCSSKWNWVPDPYVADYKYESVINAEGKEIFCSNQNFNDFTCFTSKNLEELKYNIERLKIRKEVKKAIILEFYKFSKKRSDIKDAICQ